MAKVLLGNIMGEQGPKGDPGAIDNVNENLINFADHQWEEGGLYSSGTDNPNVQGIRLKSEYAIPLTVDETYSFTDLSLYTSGVSIVQLHVFNDAMEQVQFISRSRLESTSFVSQGTQLRITYVPGENLSVRKYFLLNRIKSKLEVGDQSSPWLHVMNALKKDVTESTYGNIEGYITQQAFTSISGGQFGADRVSDYTLSENTETLNTDGEFILSPGVWSINIKIAMKPVNGGTGYLAMALYHNDVMLERDLRDADSYETLTINRTLKINQGDVLQLRVYSNGVFDTVETADYSTQANNYNPISMTKIKEG